MEESDAEEIDEEVPQLKETVKVSKKERKAMLHVLNKQLKELAVKKQLNKARKLFQQFLKKGVAPDIHSYSSLLNVYVRCQDLTRARQLFEEIESHPSVRANLITYTILLKGYCENGLMSEAAALYFDKMVEEKRANIRSLNTFLRGCMRTGMVSLALKAFRHYQRVRSSGAASTATSKKPKKDAEANDNDNSDDDEEAEGEEEDVGSDRDEIEGAPGLADESDDGEDLDEEELNRQESSCYEAIISLLARSGQIHEAIQILRDYLTAISASSAKQKSFLLTNASLSSIIARFFTIFGYFSEAKKYLQLTQEILQKQSVQRFNAKKLQQQDSRSIELFQKHQKQEIQGLLEELEEYMSALMIVSKKGSGADRELGTIVDSIACFDLLLRKVLYFGFHPGDCDLDPARPQADQLQQQPQASDLREFLLIALEDKFGFTRLSPQQFLGSLKSAPAPSTLVPPTDLQAMKDNLAAVLTEKTCESIASTQTSSQSQSQSSQRSFQVDFSKLFADCLKTLKPSDGQESSATSLAQKNNLEQSLEDYYRFLDQDNLQAAASNQSSSKPTAVVRGGKGPARSAEIPICLEIGSGNGDWIVSQASADRILFTPPPPAPTSSSTKSFQTTRRPSQLPYHQRKAALPPPGSAAPANPEPEEPVVPQKEWRIKRNWISLELRFDRSSNILSNHFLELAPLKQLYSSLDSESNQSKKAAEETELPETAFAPNNLAIFSGDAENVVRKYFPAAQLSHIFVNFPQPPDRITGGFQNKDQGKHLYTKEFLGVLLNLLRCEPSSTGSVVAGDDCALDYSRGKLTILSDNLLYVQLLASNLLLLANEIVAKHQQARRHAEKRGRDFLDDDHFIFTSPALQEEENGRKTEEILPILSMQTSTGASTGPAIIIYRGDPGVDCGHGVAASSYFDRMWSLGQKKRRWFLHLEKTKL
jgi:pentatricopeptide repeat protein